MAAPDTHVAALDTHVAAPDTHVAARLVQSRVHSGDNHMESTASFVADVVAMGEILLDNHQVPDAEEDMEVQQVPMLLGPQTVLSMHPVPT